MEKLAEQESQFASQISAQERAHTELRERYHALEEDYRKAKEQSRNAVGERQKL